MAALSALVPGPSMGPAIAPPPVSADARFEAMLRQRTPCLLAVARRIVEEEDEARDVVDEAIEIARAMLEEFRADSRGAWLQGLVVGLSVIRSDRIRLTR
jgi:DNA-directed RNA polymerase specialized sigma24 family protein